MRFMLSIARVHVIFKLSEMETLSLCLLVCRHTLIMRKETGAHKCAPVRARGKQSPKECETQQISTPIYALTIFLLFHIFQIPRLL